MIRNIDETTAEVADIPTASAPSPVSNPLWQLIPLISTANTTAFTIPEIISKTAMVLIVWCI